MTPLRVLAIPGSLRAGSLNALVLKEAARLAPAGMEFAFWDALDDLPHFSPERDTEPAPAPVAHIRGLIAGADALIVCTPEYIHALPAVLKNLLEWVVSSGVWVDKPTAAWSASPSPEGGARAQASLVHTLEVMSATVVPAASLCLTLARTGFDAEGRLLNPTHGERLQGALGQLASAARP